MKLHFAGDISFDWLAPTGLKQLLFSLFDTSPLQSEVMRDLDRMSGLSGLSARRMRTQALELGRKLHRALGSETDRADVFCANLECVLSTRGSALEDKKYTLQASPYYLQALKAFGLTHVCLANNHILDFGPAALEDTANLLEKARIAGLGLRHANAPAQKPIWVEKAGERVALLNYVDPGIIDPDPEHYLSCDPSPFPLDRVTVLDDIKRAATNGPVVVICHWGEEWSFLESEAQRSLARAMIDSGAAAVVSHHTHLVGAYEEYRNGLITYGLGNLFMMVPGFSMLRGRDRLVIELGFVKGGLDGFRMIPVSTDPEELPALDSGWQVASLRPGYLPSALKVDTPTLDSFEHLKNATITFEREGRGEPAVWAENHLAPFAVVNGKLPVGPGWRVADREWCGVAQSREEAGREFVELNVAHLDGPGRITVGWELPAGTRAVRLLYGYPDYMRMLDTVTRADLKVKLDGRDIHLKAHPESSPGWLVDDLSAHLRSSNSCRITFSAVNQTDRQAFCCFRMIAGREPADG